MEGQRSLIVNALNMKEAEILTISPKEPGTPFSSYAYIITPLLMACFLQTLPSHISIHVFVQILPSLSFQIIFLWAIYIRPIPSPPSLNFLKCHLPSKLLFRFSTTSLAEALFCYCFSFTCFQLFLKTLEPYQSANCREPQSSYSYVYKNTDYNVSECPKCIASITGLTSFHQAQLSNSAKISVDVAPPFRVAMMPCFPSSAALCFD